MNLFGHWLLAYDHSPHAERALDEALRALPPGSKLTLLHVVFNADALSTWNLDFEGADNWELPQQLQLAASDELETVAKRVEDLREDLEVEFVVREGEAEVVILEVAEELGVDLVVVGTHGRKGLRHLVMGSVAERVTRRARRPVLLVRPHAGDTFPPRRVLVPLALNPRHPEIDVRILDVAVAIAKPAEAEVVLVNVVEPELLVHWGPPSVMLTAIDRIREESEQRASDQLEKHRVALESRGVIAETRTVISTETIASSLLEVAERERVDLIVASSGLRKGLAKLGLGSVTRVLAHASPVPVVVIRPPQEAA